jgi:hypothetical protein
VSVTAVLLTVLGATVAVASCVIRVRMVRRATEQGRPIAYPWLFLVANPAMWLGLAILAAQINLAAGATAFLISIVAAFANLLRHSLRKRRMEHPEMFI